jgi:hypothetical protein
VLLPLAKRENTDDPPTKIMKTSHKAKSDKDTILARLNIFLVECRKSGTSDTLLGFAARNPSVKVLDATKPSLAEALNPVTASSP